MFVRRVIHWILSALLPNHCQLCGGSSGQLLCSACDAQLPRNQHACEVCALPFADASNTSQNSVCGECLDVKPGFDKLVAPFVYQGEVAWLINHFKHKSRVHYGEYLGEQLQAKLQQHLDENETPDLITAVPLHWTRNLSRGFNQAELLARKLARNVGVPYKNLLVKNKRTDKQQNLQRKARLKNLRGAFSTQASLEGKFISIVDDVVTTGATAQTLASLLVDAGARRVEIWALARTPKATHEPAAV